MKKMGNAIEEHGHRQRRVRHFNCLEDKYYNKVKFFIEKSEILLEFT